MHNVPIKRNQKQLLFPRHIVFGPSALRFVLSSIASHLVVFGHIQFNGGSQARRGTFANLQLCVTVVEHNVWDDDHDVVHHFEFSGHRNVNFKPNHTAECIVWWVDSERQDHAGVGRMGEIPGLFLLCV